MYLLLRVLGHVLCCVGRFLGVVALGRGSGEGVYGWWGFKRVSKIVLGNMVWSSFKWLLSKCSA